MKVLSLAQFASVIGQMPLAVAVEQHHAMERACKVVEREAKAAIGTYQPASGPFPAWDPLAQSTLQGWGNFPGKIALGYAPPDNPELRTGGLRNSIEHTVEQGLMIGGVEGAVGSNEPVMVFQELGTSKMPPRSILGGAAARKSDEVAEILGSAVAMTLAGRGM